MIGSVILVRSIQDDTYRVLTRHGWFRSLGGGADTTNLSAHPLLQTSILIVHLHFTAYSTWWRWVNSTCGKLVKVILNKFLHAVKYISATIRIRVFRVQSAKVQESLVACSLKFLSVRIYMPQECLLAPEKK